MGDFADDALGCVFDDMDAWSDYARGDIDDHAAYNRGLIDELGFSIPHGIQRTKTCRCCNKGGMSWGQHLGKWRLFENGSLHRCPANPLND
jgi:hypothetical protein